MTSSPGLHPSKVVLDNGVAVIAKANPTSPSVSIVLSLRSGAYSDPPGKEGAAALTARVLDRGTISRPAAVIADELDGRGASLSVTTSRHQTSIVATCLADDFAPVLALAADIALHPAFRDEEVATRRENLISSIRQEADDPAPMAVDTFMRALYGSHPYARKVRGTVEAVESLKRQDLVRSHQRGFVPTSATAVVVGDVEEKAAMDAVARALASWSGGEKLVAPVPDPVKPATRQLVGFPMMNKAQADIAYGFIGIRRSEPNYQHFSVMNNALGQYAIGGRLGDTIRERQGMAYYVLSSLDAGLGPGPLMIRAGVSAANVEKTIASIDAELNAILDVGFTAKEIDESKRFLMGSLPRQLETNAAIAAFLLNAEVYGLGLDYDERVPGLIDAVTLDDANFAARRLVDPLLATIAVAGPWTPKNS